ncbi:hypothetical protein NLI96_g3653 [Meripilus lineatus]|uniref:Uncharacterized protein n=1 Tax=Meripilus lineatus TaxID=2056292 RepID=A0AAD5YKV6_9APHY|nr:hypothetical protein NLI96_g3653 [Physisporinus lineatus]
MASSQPRRTPNPDNEFGDPEIFWAETLRVSSFPSESKLGIPQTSRSFKCFRSALPSEVCNVPRSFKPKSNPAFSGTVENFRWTLPLPNEDKWLNSKHKVGVLVHEPMEFTHPCFTLASE